jgi:hypothetical protein
VTRKEWIAAYRRAWEERDPDAAAALFTEDALYRSHPFREPQVGTEGIRAYWTRATSTQADVEVRFGEPIVSGDKSRRVVGRHPERGRRRDRSRLPAPPLRPGRPLRGAPRVLARRAGPRDPPDGWGR